MFLHHWHVGMVLSVGSSAVKGILKNERWLKSGAEDKGMKV